MRRSTMREALGAIEVYELLVGQRGWSPERYRDWLVDVWANRLLAAPRRDRSGSVG